MSNKLTMINLVNSTIANSESMPINNMLKNNTFLEKEDKQNKNSLFSNLKIFLIFQKK